MIHPFDTIVASPDGGWLHQRGEDYRVAWRLATTDTWLAEVPRELIAQIPAAVWASGPTATLERSGPTATVTVKAGGLAWQLPTTDGWPQPAPPAAAGDWYPSRLLTDAWRPVLPCMGTEYSKPALCGLEISVVGGYLRLTATDSYRLGQWHSAGSVDAPDGSVVSADFHDELARDGMSQRLRTALSLDGDWLAAVLRQAHDRLMSLRTMPNGQPDAGGLVIAMDQAHAHGIAALIRRHFGVPAEVVVSDDPTASDRIARFATSDAPWLVAVRMVSEGVDIPRLRVGVYATTVTTELFFRQAVGRFVRWQTDRGSQKAYVFLPDDPRLRTHAFQIAEARRHVLRPPVPNDDDPEGPDRADDLTGGVEAFEPEQLSLFSVLSSVATGMRISAVTPDGVAYDDEPEQLATADADPELDGLLDLLLPDIPTDAGWSRDLGRSVAEVKQDLRARNAAVAQRLVDLTGLSHGKVNAEMNRLANVAAVGAATTDQLDRRLRQAEAWLGRIRGRGPSDRPR